MSPLRFFPRLRTQVVLENDVSHTVELISPQTQATPVPGYGTDTFSPHHETSIPAYPNFNLSAACVGPLPLSSHQSRTSSQSHSMIIQWYIAYRTRNPKWVLSVLSYHAFTAAWISPLSVANDFGYPQQLLPVGHPPSASTALPAAQHKTG